MVRAFGPVGELVGHSLDSLSLAIYRLTKSKADEDRNSGHRTFTHTLVFAILLTLGVGAAASVTSTFTVREHEFVVGQVATLVIMWAALHLAMFGLAEKWVKKNRRKYGLLFIVAISGGLTYLTVSQLPPGGYPWLGFAVGFGSLIHCLGDAITKAGVPVLWPLPIIGRRWYEIRLGPGFRAGGGFEYSVVLPLFTTVAIVSAFLVVPEAQDVLSTFINGR